MKKDSLRSAVRVMVVLVLSLVCVLSSVTAVLSQCKCTCTITKASVKQASNYGAEYRFTGICTYTPSSGGVTCPGPQQITGAGTWMATDTAGNVVNTQPICPEWVTVGYTLESIDMGGHNIGLSSSTCPKNPWINDNVQCTTPSGDHFYGDAPACLKAMTTYPATAALLTSAQKQALKQQEQAKYVIKTDPPEILSPAEGQIVWVTHTVPIKVKYIPCPSFGHLVFGFAWRANTNDTWHAENISVPCTISNNIATGYLHLNKPGFWRFSVRIASAVSNMRNFRIIEPPKPSTPPPGTIKQWEKPPINK